MSIFKKIIDKQIPAKIVHEDDTCLAFYDIQAVAPMHVLVIPKKEIPSLAHLTTEDSSILGHLLLTTSQIAQKLGLASSGYRVVINTGTDGGQSVDHLHLHLIGGRPLSWPPG